MWSSVAVVGTPFAGHVRWLDVSSVRHDPPPPSFHIHTALLLLLLSSPSCPSHGCPRCACCVSFVLYAYCLGSTRLDDSGILGYTYYLWYARAERTYDVRAGQGDSQDGERCAASAERDRDSGQHVLRDGA